MASELQYKGKRVASSRKKVAVLPHTHPHFACSAISQSKPWHCCSYGRTRETDIHPVLTTIVHYSLAPVFRGIETPQSRQTGMTCATRRSVFSGPIRCSPLPQQSTPSYGSINTLEATTQVLSMSLQLVVTIWKDPILPSASTSLDMITGATF